MPSDAPFPATPGLPNAVTGIGMGFLIVFIVIVLFIVAVFFFLMYAMRRRWTAAKHQGFDPLTADIQLMGRLNRSALLAPATDAVPVPAGDNVATRLAELDALRDNGTLSSAEHAQARAKIIEEI